MAGQGSAERTEKPSGKKLQKAREQGQVPRSRDLSMAASLLALTIAFSSLGPAMIIRLANRTARGLATFGDHAVQTVSIVDLTSLLIEDAIELAILVGPLILTAAFVGVAATIAQSGWVVSTAALAPKWSRLSPANGLRRLLPSQSGFDLVKAAIGVTVLGVFAWNTVSELVTDSARMVWLSPFTAAASGWARVLTLLQRAGLAMLVIAAADYFMQRWRHYSSLRMTKQEVRDEAKGTEVSPEVKSRVRRIQRDMHRRRMLKAVKTATVVVTNPTHYAVALDYRREKSAAPRVVAKGKDLLAERIRAEARHAGVPIVENVSLAQALYKGVEVGDSIPVELFGAVAEVLAYLVRIKQLML